MQFLLKLSQDQGRCGDCYMLGALAAVAANRKRFVRQVFVHYDMDVGVREPRGGKGIKRLSEKKHDKNVTRI